MLRKSKTVERIRIAAVKGYTADKQGRVFAPSGYELKLNNRKGYYRFCAGSSSAVIKVHQFVAYLKYGDASFGVGIEVRHLNNNSSDNSWDNLQIGTPSQNAMDSLPSTRLAKARAAAAKRRKLTTDEVNQLREARRAGASYKELMVQYNIAKSTVSLIVNEKTYNYDQ